MHPSFHAKTCPDKPALILAESGEILTYRALDQRSNQGAHFFRGVGLRQGDVVALFMENGACFLEAAWAAQRSGLYFSCVSTRSSPRELAYILEDSGAKLLLCSEQLADVALQATSTLPQVAVTLTDRQREKDASFETLRARYPSTPIEGESEGSDLLYSSGTTGRPKAIKPKVPLGNPIGTKERLTELARTRFGIDADSVYLTPAPLYHTAPLRWSMAVNRLGGTVVLLKKFDPHAALQAIERYRINMAQWVPTHFVRLLKLSDTERTRYDLSSLKVAIHAAAPCPVPVKEAMIAWWGPILEEYYAGTEGIGMTAISSLEWLKKKGSVGRPVLGQPHICSENGELLAAGREGIIYFSGGGEFEYLNAPEKTMASRNAHGWSTFGDVGTLDEDGYLFLTDRKSFMIISGGVNIYPQEIENHLITHPKVADVAVIGAPDDDMGERVVAVVQPATWSDAGPALAAELAAFVRAHLSPVKVPRQVDFLKELPRHENGKLYKKLLRDSYWRKGSGHQHGRI